MKLKTTVTIALIVLVLSSTLTSAEVINNGNVASDNKNDQITSTNADVLMPPWSEHSGWCNKWTDGLGESQGNAETTPYDGFGRAYVKSRFFGKAQTDTHFYHQTSFDDYISHENGYYDFIFTYDYDGTFEYEMYIFPRLGDALLEYEIKITFIVYIEGSQNSYEKVIILEKATCTGPAWDEKTLEDKLDIAFEDIYVSKGKKVVFSAIVDIYLNTATGGLGKMHAEAKLNGKLERVTITDAWSDHTPPVVKLKKPIRALYLKNEMRIPLSRPVILGNIDIEVDAVDYGSGVDKVEFYIDNELKNEDTEAPYVWNWNERKYYSNTQIKVIAYDKASNSDEETISLVLYLNPWGD
jgi:hypothetical protein